MLSALQNAVLDWVAPVRCSNCNEGQKPICQNCLELVDFLFFSQQKPATFDSLVCMARFSGPLISYVHEMKFGPNRPCAEFAGDLLFLYTQWIEADCVTAAPLSRWRRWERGFNQAEIMARRFAELSGIPYLPLLHKTRFTSPQAETHSREERATHLKGSIGINPNSEHIPPRVLVIDDVCTTGATLAECGASLIQAGVEELHALTLCREL